MSGGIYLIQDDDQLVEMTEQAYDSEDLLQGLLAKYPNLLAGDQIDSVAPRRWLLIAREIGLPSEEEGSDRWAVDHLFLDQDAIPTLVEVKRSADTRIRREVVGQMLEYAANAVVYWPVETIRAQFEATCKDQGHDPEQKLVAILSSDADQDAFWQKAKTNLQAGKIRLIFVADEIPSELRRIVEFLNVQMDPAEVLAVEIKQYVGRNLKTLVPRVIGQTAEAQQKKSLMSHETKEWDEDSFFETLKKKCDDDEITTARKIFEWISDNKPPIRWGKGKQNGAFGAFLKHKGRAPSLISVWTSGWVSVDVKYISPFKEESKRVELLSRLDTSELDIPLSSLKDEAVLNRLFETIEWAVQEIKAS